MADEGSGGWRAQVWTIGPVLLVAAASASVGPDSFPALVADPPALEERGLVHFLVAPRDRSTAACAAAPEGDLRCALTTPRAEVPPVMGADVLQPYTTPDLNVFLGAGLWRQGDVQRWLATDPAADARVVVTCELAARIRVEDVAVRTAEVAAWDATGPLVAGRLERCEVAR